MGVHPSGGGYANYSLLLRFSFSFRITSRTATSWTAKRPANRLQNPQRLTAGTPQRPPARRTPAIIPQRPPARPPARQSPNPGRQIQPNGSQLDGFGTIESEPPATSGNPANVPQLDGKATSEPPTESATAHRWNSPATTSKASGNPPHLTHEKTAKNSI